MRDTKFLINLYKSSPNDPKIVKELKNINESLNYLQEVLLDFAGDISKEYRNKWKEEFKKVIRGEKVYRPPNIKSRFITGAPRDMMVTRVNLNTAISEDRIQEIAEYHGLIIEFEEDNIIVLYGEAEDIKRSLKEIATFFGE